MDSLMDSTVGRYEVVTAASTYLVDLDRRVICRTPRSRNPEGSLLRRDAELVTLLAVVECSTGRPMELRIDLHVAGIPFTVRQTTPVVSITRVPSPGEQTQL